MQPPPISQAEIDARVSDHIDELLELWWAEQGASKPRDLKLIALATPFPRGDAIRALDLCCGPGDVGRAIRKIYPKAHVDCIDRDPFLTSICRAANQRARIPGTLVVRDLEDDGWLDELAGNYDVVATVNAIHWFDEQRAGQLIKDVHGTLRAGSGRGANALLGYDHTTLLGPPGANRIGDNMSVAGWLRLLERAGFELSDVLWRDADQVVIGARKSASGESAALG